MFHRSERSRDATPAACRAAVDAAAEGSTAVLLCVADQPGVDLAAIADALSSSPVPVTGAIFPALLLGADRHTTGGLALGFAPRTARAVVQSTFERPEILASLLEPALVGGPGAQALVVLVDGQAAGASTALLDALRLPYLHAGATVIGGGAGYSGYGATTGRACLFTEQGVLPRGAGVVLRVDGPTGVAYEHGWTRLAGPYFATRASDTTIEELDWRAASAVYAEATGAPRGAFSPEIAMHHPIAVLGLRETMALRDPVAFTEGGGVYTLGPIPEHALIAILRAEPDALIGAAGAAARAASVAAGVAAPRGLVFDCVSRNDALGARFGEELVRIQREFAHPIAGALTLGEIASTGARGVEFHNKTVVVAAG